jgi:hypothetical protein
MSERKKAPDIEITVPCVHFPAPGAANTLRTLEVAAQRAKELGITNIVVASSSGETGLEAVRLFRGKNLVIVTHSAGFLRPNYQEMDPDKRKRIEESGAKILTCQHALGGINRAVRKKLGTYELDEIIAFALRTLGEGFKVAVEISLMAADAGLIPSGEPCLAIGGTGQGADTAVVLRPANAQNFFDLRVMEILAKPRLE